MIATHAQREGARLPIRAAVRALLYSETLAPEEITSRLDLQPTKTAEKGVKYGKRTGTQYDVPRHMWQLSSESHVSAVDLTSHLDWLLSRLFPIRERLRVLRDSGDDPKQSWAWEPSCKHESHNSLARGLFDHHVSARK